MRLSQLFKDLLPANWLTAAKPVSTELYSSHDCETVGNEIDLQALQGCSAGVGEYGWDDMEEFCQAELDSSL